MPVKFETKKVPMETLGEYLSEIRNGLGLTLEEVAQQTGLYEKFIYYIEQGKYQLLPPDVYVLGFLKKLANIYKVPETALIVQYKKERGIVENVSRDKISPQKNWRNWLEKITITPKFLTLSGSAALGVIAFFYIIAQVFAINRTPSLEIFEPKNDAVIKGSSISVVGKTEPGMVLAINGQNVFVQNDGTFHATVGVAPGQKELKVDAQNKFGKQSTKVLSLRVEEPTIAGASTVVPSDLQLELRFSKATKISMVRDGVEIADEIVPAQGIKSIVAQEKVVLTTSDAGSTVAILNGKELGVLGKSGQVLTIPFTKEATSLVGPAGQSEPTPVVTPEPVVTETPKAVAKKPAPQPEPVEEPEEPVSEPEAPAYTQPSTPASPGGSVTQN
jgi:cytoskeleton protein RodZ